MLKGGQRPVLDQNTIQTLLSWNGFRKGHISFTIDILSSSASFPPAPPKKNVILFFSPNNWAVLGTLFHQLQAFSLVEPQQKHRRPPTWPLPQAATWRMERLGIASKSSRAIRHFWASQLVPASFGFFRPQKKNALEIWEQETLGWVAHKVWVENKSEKKIDQPQWDMFVAQFGTSAWHRALVVFSIDWSF